MNDVELETIRFRAYQIWDREGRPHGRHEEHWQAALRELGLEESATDATREAIAEQTRQWDEDEEAQ
jgi:hypothetical protein